MEFKSDVVAGWSSDTLNALLAGLDKHEIDTLLFGVSIQGSGNFANKLVKGYLTADEINNYRKKKFLCLSVDNTSRPLYWGIFISDNNFANIGDMHGTLLHVNCLFLTNETIVPAEFEKFIGATIELKIIGISFNISGQCLIVEKNHVLLNSVDNPHIILNTNRGSSPADVGKNAGNPIMFHEPFVVHGIFSPT